MEGTVSLRTKFFPDALKDAAETAVGNGFFQGHGNAVGTVIAQGTGIFVGNIIQFFGRL